MLKSSASLGGGLPGGSPSTLYVAVDTYANLVALGTSGQIPDKAQVFATNAGINGSPFFYVSALNRLLPAGARVPLASMSMMVGKAPTFTGTTNGAVTFGTALPSAATHLINASMFLWYPANSLVNSHPAGFYWTSFQNSTTAAIVYNNTYTPTAGVQPTAPATLTPFYGAVIGGTGGTSVITYFKPPVILGGLMGNYGSLRSRWNAIITNSAGSKSIGVVFGSTDMYAADAFTTSLLLPGDHIIKNYGASLQMSNGTGNVAQNTSGIFSAGEDTTLDVPVSYVFKCSVATDWIISLRVLAEVEVLS